MSEGEGTPLRGYIVKIAAAARAGIASPGSTAEGQIG